MGCTTCSNKKGELPSGCQNNGACGITGCGDMLDVHDWLSNIFYVEEERRGGNVEVKFKGTRKEYYANPREIALEIGDYIVVQTETGHDVGCVSLCGELVSLQMKKKNFTPGDQMPVILRKAGERDMELYNQAKDRENETMFRTRKIARDLGLVMKISDVEYQADNRKATFFYTADGRVDFRELIKLLAREFRIKVEMRQIGLRQEAGRLGGVGDCGRELCCSTWLTDFNTVPTAAAKYQNLFLNPLKLSGQCGRLKCCLNYELDTYLEALDAFPPEETVIQTSAGMARVFKMDILKGMMWFHFPHEDGITKLYPLSIESVNKLVAMNKSGKKPQDLSGFMETPDEPAVKEEKYKDVVGEESLTRFDEQKKNRGRGKGKKRKGKGRGKGNRNPNRNRNNKDNNSNKG